MNSVRMERLSTAHTEVVIQLGADGPAIAHWGAPLGDAATPEAITAANDPGLIPATAIWTAAWPIFPSHAAGCEARPGLLGSRSDGSDFAPRWTTEDIQREVINEVDTVYVTATDVHAGLTLITEIALDDALRISATLKNVGTSEYRLEGLAISLPVPDYAAELRTLGGRWTAEFGLTTHDWVSGTLSAENRRGRTSHESVPLVIAGERGCGEWRGEVWAAHLAWSGNHRWLAERTVDGKRHLQLGELLHPGEVVLGPGETYRTPEVIAVYSPSGLTPASWGFHRHLRARPQHPRSPRPVTFNSWEATYFDHDLDKLTDLAHRAAALGVERFVLDDGWFGGRRDDRAGLGDWWVSPEAHPDGLGPLIGIVHQLGMQFGIWVEPEMANPDSELLRAHPDWALIDDRYEPVMWRNQLVVDLTQPAVFAHVKEALNSLLADHQIDFVKWDMNRPHVQAATTNRSPGTHLQTLAVYRLLDELRAVHPTVEFESCASGGGRIDAEILRRTERVWTSDNNDPLARQHIQHGASILIPPEVMGAHIGPRRAHTTGRVTNIELRAITAVFGHLGIEADLLKWDEEELNTVRSAITWYRTHRELLHHGDLVRGDLGEPFMARGVYARDRSRALLGIVALDMGHHGVMEPLRLPGLTADASYRITHMNFGRAARTAHLEVPAWWHSGSLIATGRQLDVHGVRVATLSPGHGVILELERLEHD